MRDTISPAGGSGLKILEVKCLAVPEIQVIRFARFRDHRGYFTEHFRRSDFRNQLPFMKDIEFYQCNESASKPGTVRGLHFQWNPTMGKLVRTLSGRMTDLVLDIRKGSPTFGKILAYDMPANPHAEFAEWIWVPPGFAHGNFFTEDSLIEYFCSGEYSPGCEAGISPLALDIDWSLCDPVLRDGFNALVLGSPCMTDKDRNGYNLAAWAASPDSNRFTFQN
jgi:dTDP-4-dehydrorhamnose 3,5-epimerase